MGKADLSRFFGQIGASLIKHSPGILTGVGIAGMIVAGIAAVKVTPDAMEKIEEKKAEDKVDELSFTDKVKATWKCYWPAAATCVLSAGCIIGASSVNARRNAALATACTLSETALAEYHNKTYEVLGEKKEQLIRDAIAKDRVENLSQSSQEVIVTDKGNTLCYDIHSDRQFYGDIDNIKRAVNELNSMMLSETYVSLNDFYYLIGRKSVGWGNNMGWNINDGMVEVVYSSVLTEKGVPCLAIDFRDPPRYDFRDR